jgi:hypothetical protein
MIIAVERRTNQLAIRETFLIARVFGCYGVDDVFHSTTCAHGGRNAPQHLSTVIVGPRCELTVYGITANWG